MVCEKHDRVYLFVNPLLVVLGVLNESLREPETNLTLSRLDGVRSVNDVVAHIATEISADGTGGRLQRLGGAHHLTSDGNDVVSLPHHGDDGRGAHETSEAGVETLALVLSVVLLKEGHGGNQHLQTHQLESLLLEAGNDLTNVSALDSVGLNSKESSLLDVTSTYLSLHEACQRIFVVMMWMRENGNLQNFADSALDSTIKPKSTRTCPENSIRRVSTSFPF